MGQKDFVLRFEKLLDLDGVLLKVVSNLLQADLSRESDVRKVCAEGVVDLPHHRAQLWQPLVLYSERFPQSGFASVPIWDFKQ